MSVSGKIKKNKNAKGFSIAEAMITLLIVSVALAAMAPIISKKSVNSGDGNSKWLYTKNRTDITRPAGNVAVGVPISQNPSGKFEIRNDKNGVVLNLNTLANATANVLEIKKGNTLVASVNANGTVSLYDQNTTGNDTLLTLNNGAWRNSLRRNGGIFVNGETEAQRLMSLRSPKGEVAWINGDGSSSFGVPTGMVSFFARSEGCPSGWTNVTAWGWGGMYFRVADGNNAYNVYQADQNKWHSHQFRNQMTWDNMNYRNQTMGRGDAGDLLGPYYNEQIIIPEGGNEARPKTIPLYGCVKN